jgi:hypothetical protein
MCRASPGAPAACSRRDDRGGSRTGATGYGSVVLAVGVASLVATFLDFSLEEAVVDHGSQPFAAGDLLVRFAAVGLRPVVDVDDRQSSGGEADIPV